VKENELAIRVRHRRGDAIWTATIGQQFDRHQLHSHSWRWLICILVQGTPFDDWSRRTILNGLVGNMRRVYGF
jgi:hypothetical protein